MERYRVARQTARQALGILKAEGLVEAVPGRGHFVRERPPVFHQSGSLGHFAAEAREQGYDPQWILTDVTGPREAPEEIAACLNLGDGDDVIIRRVMLTLNGQPFQLAESYYPHRLVRDTGIGRHEKLRGGPGAELQRLGFRLDHFVEDIKTRMPTEQEAISLDLPTAVPVLAIRRITFAIHSETPEQPQPVAVNDYVLAGDRHILSYRVPAQRRWSEKNGRWIPAE